jgi:hypothetical protein
MITCRFGEASRPLSEDVAENSHAGRSASRHRAPALRRCLASIAGDLGYNAPITVTLFIRRAHEHEQVRPFPRCRVPGGSRCRGEWVMKRRARMTRRTQVPWPSARPGIEWIVWDEITLL